MVTEPESPHKKCARNSYFSRHVNKTIFQHIFLYILFRKWKWILTRRNTPGKVTLKKVAKSNIENRIDHYYFDSEKHTRKRIIKESGKSNIDLVKWDCSEHKVKLWTYVWHHQNIYIYIKTFTSNVFPPHDPKPVLVPKSHPKDLKFNGDEASSHCFLSFSWKTHL